LLSGPHLSLKGTGEDEIVKIADFGLSKIQTDEERLQTSCGTPGYGTLPALFPVS
jgi:serine/threonine protein kinase